MSKSKLKPRSILLRLSIYFCLIILFYVLAFLVYLITIFDNFSYEIKNTNKKLWLNENNAKYKYLISNYFQVDSNIDYKNDCYFEHDSCFDIKKCILFTQTGPNLKSSIRIYIYGKDEQNRGFNYSKEYQEFIETIFSSEFYEPNPNKACLFIPMIDTLNENNLDAKNAENYLNNLDL